MKSRIIGWKDEWKCELQSFWTTLSISIFFQCDVHLLTLHVPFGSGEGVELSLIEKHYTKYSPTYIYI